MLLNKETETETEYFLCDPWFQRVENIENFLEEFIE